MRWLTQSTESKGGIELKLLNDQKESIYICLEGLKGAGKTTIFNYVVSRLKEINVEFSTVSPTNPTGDSYFIERLFKKFQFLKSRRFPRIFLYAHRSNHAAVKANWNKSLILGERSIATSYASKWRKSSILSWINFSIINILENKIKTPDYVIYVDVPHEILRKRIETRDKERDIDDCELRLIEMEKAYFQMMNHCRIKRMSNVKWIKVSGIGELETIGEKMLELILQLSGNSKINVKKIN